MSLSRFIPNPKTQRYQVVENPSQDEERAGI
jgi:hypothetical protein